MLFGRRKLIDRVKLAVGLAGITTDVDNEDKDREMNSIE